MVALPLLTPRELRLPQYCRSISFTIHLQDSQLTLLNDEINDDQNPLSLFDFIVAPRLLVVSTQKHTNQKERYILVSWTIWIVIVGGSFKSPILPS